MKNKIIKFKIQLHKKEGVFLEIMIFFIIFRVEEFTIDDLICDELITKTILNKLKETFILKICKVVY